jgi:hypothetical protein
VRVDAALIMRDVSAAVEHLRIALVSRH